MTRPKPRTAVISTVEAEYPNQYERMNRFLRSHRLSGDEIHDVIHDAWLKAIETFDDSRGIDLVQWAWWLLQHNFLPAYGRNKKKQQLLRISPEEAETDPPQSENLKSTHEADAFISFLRKNLPDDLAEMLETLLSILKTTDSKQIYQGTAKRLRISIKECRTRMKRLRRACHKLNSRWEARQ